MATTTKNAYDARKAFADYYVYVPLGAGQLLIEKGKELSTWTIDRAKDGRARLMGAYDELATRGRKLSTSIRRSVYTQRAIDQTKNASRQVRRAATSVRQAADSTAQASRAAARKIG